VAKRRISIYGERLDTMIIQKLGAHAPISTPSEKFSVFTGSSRCDGSADRWTGTLNS
jgi:hypothetical protein